MTKLDAELTLVVRGRTILTEALYDLAQLHYELVPDRLTSEEFFQQLPSIGIAEMAKWLESIIRDEEM